MSYTVQHLATSQSHTRSFVYFNPTLEPYRSSIQTNSERIGDLSNPVTIKHFHSTLPSYAPTALHSLAELATELGVSHVFLKDESTRFGLPAFKILGASWAIHRALCERLSLDAAQNSYHEIRQALERSSEKPELVLCTEGNWGRACARYGGLVGVKTVIYVPGFMSNYTKRLIEGEGAEVRVLKDGSYDDSIAAARSHASAHPSAMLVLDTSFDDYNTIPQWVTDGYTTMLAETDEQIKAQHPNVRPNTLFASVGVGSWAQAVVAHYRRVDTAAETTAPPIPTRIVSVEPTVAASLKESLHCGNLTPIRTGETIMAGMCCGTTSQIAWPILRNGVNAAVAVSDNEAHQDVLYLKSKGIHAGPCGAATLSALRKFLASTNVLEKQEKERLVIVLFSTEGEREYDVPA